MLLFLAAFIAGFVDSIVGGGGLIQLPALLIAFPTTPLPLILGTNKFAAMSGTAVAVWRYQRSLRFDLSDYLPAITAALLGACGGAVLATRFDSSFMKPLVLVMLVGVWILFFLKPDFGSIPVPAVKPRERLMRSSLLAFVIGVYDGFFGPGTGTWLIIGGVTWLGLNFLNASALAKVLNLATNFSALVSFAIAGAVDWKLGAVLAICNIAGSLIGARLALTKGNRFVRVFFLFVVAVLIAKLGGDLASRAAPSTIPPAQPALLVDPKISGVRANLVSRIIRDSPQNLLPA